MHALALVDHAARRRPVVGPVAPPVLHQQHPVGPLDHRSGHQPVTHRPSVPEIARAGAIRAARRASGEVLVELAWWSRWWCGRLDRLPSARGSPTWAGARPTPPAGTWSAGEVVAGRPPAASPDRGRSASGRRGRAGSRRVPSGLRVCTSAVPMRRRRAGSARSARADDTTRAPPTHTATSTPAAGTRTRARSSVRIGGAPRPAGSAMRSREAVLDLGGGQGQGPGQHVEIGPGATTAACPARRTAACRPATGSWPAPRRRWARCRPAAGCGRRRPARAGRGRRPARGDRAAAASGSTP